MRTLRAAIPTLGRSTSSGGWKPDERRGNRQRRGYGAEWERKRARIKERDQGLCQSCSRAGRIRPGSHCDHRIAKSIARLLGWSTEQVESDENLEWKCVDCHNEKTRLEAHLIAHGNPEQLERYVAEHRGGVETSK